MLKKCGKQSKRMKIYNYKADNGKEFILQFTSRIYLVVKTRLGVILDQEISKNPYNKELLLLCLFEFYKQGCSSKGVDAEFSIDDLKESIEVDEMLLIYTTLILERGASNSRKLTKDGLN